MSMKIVIDPITRISGFLQIEVQIDKGKIIDAKCSGLLYRGFEKMLVGRNPIDVIYFTERICGICSTAHSIASCLALEDALLTKVDNNGFILRDILHGFEFLQNHLRHFYLYTVPDYVKVADIPPLIPIEHNDFRIPKEKSNKIGKNYFKAIEYSREAHKLLALLGGKAPHNHGAFVGGVTSNIDALKISAIKSSIAEIKEFIENEMTQDISTICEYYSDYFCNGIGYGNLMTYGLYNKYDKDVFYVEPAVKIGDKQMNFNEKEITESVYNAWYTLAGNPQYSKEDAYTWVKAPRYNSNAMEVGPLARMILSGKYKGGISTLDRINARVLEANKIAGIIEKLTERLIPKEKNINPYIKQDNAQGRGLTDTTRGALGHWLKIKDSKIENYTIITPSTWNLSPTDKYGIKGVVEKALIGTKIEKTSSPVEVGRIVRSFDPCISCATHIISDKYPSQIVKVI